MVEAALLAADDPTVGSATVATPGPTCAHCLKARSVQHTVPMGALLPPRNVAALRAERADIVGHRSAVIALNEQWLVDAEVRNTRRTLLRMARRRTKIPSLGFLDADFLSAADLQTVQRAVIDAAVGIGRAAAADLQVYDARTQSLLIAHQHGLGTEFLAFFASVARSTPSACAVAWATRAPVVIDHVARSPIFAGQPTLEPMVDAGSRAVASYPLLGPGGAVAGVLSFHYRKAPTEWGDPALVASGAQAALAVLS